MERDPMFYNTTDTYGLIAQLLHWLTAILILVLFPLGLYMHELPDSSGIEAAYKAWFYSLHKTIGVSVFAVATIRVAWALASPHPRPLHGERKYETLAAQSVHWMLYGAIIFMPLTGWLYHAATEGFAPIWWPLSQNLPFVPKDQQLARVFGIAHQFTAVLLGASIVLHIGGALKHVFLDRDETLDRMIPGRYRNPAEIARAPFFTRLPFFLAASSFVILTLAIAVSYNLAERNIAQKSPVTNASPGSDTNWLIDYGKSQLNIQIVQSGKPVNGTFKRWAASVVFDHRNLESARASVEIDIASLSLGTLGERAVSVNFLNAAQFPHAKFVSDEFVGTGDNSFEARGHLTLVGKTKPIVLPFTLRMEEDHAFVEGTVHLNRLDYGLGATGFSGEAMLGFDVKIDVKLQAEKVNPS